MRTKSIKKAQLIKTIVLHTILIIFGVFFIFPLFWMIITSLKSPSDMINPEQFFPSKLMWSNYEDALTAIPFLRYTKNSIIIAGACVLGSVASSAFTAYAFAKLKFPGRNILFMIMMALMMIPSQVILIPMFTMYAKVGLLNTYIPLIVPCFFGVGCSMYIFLLRQFFMGIPKELAESGVIDGASQFKIFYKLTLPLAKPGLITVALFTFMFTWNDFFGPLIYLTDKQKMTLAIGLRSFQTQYDSKYHLLMAASLVAMLPTLLLFFLAQKKFIEGITFSGIKG